MWGSSENCADAPEKALNVACSYYMYYEKLATTINSSLGGMV